MNLKTIRSDLTARMDAFLKAHEMTENQFGLLSSNNSAMASRVRGGKSTLETIQKLTEWMDAYDRAHPVKKKRRLETTQAAA
jgi:hypothetical protein